MDVRHQNNYYYSYKINNKYKLALTDFSKKKNYINYLQTDSLTFCCE